MGTFLSITSVVGKSQTEVVNSLLNYAKNNGGGLEKESLPIEHNNCCVIEEANNNTTIFNPYAFLEWDKSSEFISKDLNAPVFSFHIHDGDFWMYVLFVNGEIVDQFNPVPDYWDENISEEELDLWKGNASVIHQYINSVQPVDVEKYLVRWNYESDEIEKAYSDDEFEQEDWQLIDFMRKIGLPFPLNEDGSPKADTYKLWTTQLALAQKESQLTKKQVYKTKQKPWWKFW